MMSREGEGAETQPWALAFTVAASLTSDTVSKEREAELLQQFQTIFLSGMETCLSLSVRLKVFLALCFFWRL